MSTAKQSSRITMRNAEKAGATAIETATGVRPFGVSSSRGRGDMVRIVAFRSLKNTSVYADCMVDLITGLAGDVRTSGHDISVRDAGL